MSEIITIKECRICFEIENNNNILISPCLCDGTSKYIHKKCLVKWRKLCGNIIAKERCMECRAPYLIEYKYKIEEKMIFGIPNPGGFFVLIYIFTSIIFGINVYFDKNQNILQFIMPNVKKTPIMLYFETQPAILYVLYFSFSLYLVTILFFCFICHGIKFKINRRQKYLKYMRMDILIYLLNIILYYPMYRMADFQFIFVFLLSFLYIIFQPVGILLYIYKNDKILKKINTLNIENFIEYGIDEIELLNMRNEINELSDDDESNDDESNDDESNDDESNDDELNGGELDDDEYESYDSDESDNEEKEENYEADIENNLNSDFNSEIEEELHSPLLENY